MNENELFYTEDFPLAITLKCLGFKFMGVERTQNKERLSFVFQNSREIGEVIEKFWSDSLLVEPKTFFSASRYLKQHIHNNS